MSEPLRCALVAASALVRAGLRNGLAAHGGIEVVLDSASVGQSRAAAHGQAEVLVVDAPTALDASAAMAVAAEAPPLVLLVDGAAPAHAEALVAGCSLLPRDAPVPAIAAAAQAAADGLVASTRELLRGLQLGGAAAIDDGAAARLEPLTPREREVLRQMSFGLGNREIAEELRISAHTAKFHVAQIIAKLDASSRAHAVAKGLRAGLVEL